MFSIIDRVPTIVKPYSLTKKAPVPKHEGQRDRECFAGIN